MDQLAELFTDDGSESDFSGFEEEDLRNEKEEYDFENDDDEHIVNPIPPSGYNHPWLQMFFRPGFIGPLRCHEDSTEQEIMSLFISEDLINTCLVETNKYANDYMAKQAAIPPHSRVKKWVDTMMEEIRAFIALVMLLGINKRSSFDLHVYVYMSTADSHGL